MVEIHKNVDDAQKQKKAQAEQDASVHSSLKKIKKKFVVLSGKGGRGQKPVLLLTWPWHLPKRDSMWVLWMLICMDLTYRECSD